MSFITDSLKTAAAELLLALFRSEAVLPLPLGCAYADQRHYPGATQYVGDGRYELRPGDSVLLNNGIRLTIAFQQRADQAPLPEYTHEFVIQAFVGDDPTPVTGIPYAIVVDAAGRSPMNCVDLYRVFNVSYVTSSIVSGDPTVTLVVESLTHDSFSSREEIAESCLKNGETASNCEEIIPWEEFKTEARYDEDEYTVALPKAMDPALAYERLAQLRECREKLVSWSSIDTTLPAIGWRYVDLAWPSAQRGIEGTEEDEFLTICRGVQQLLLSEMNLPPWFEEGLAQYAQMSLSGKIAPTRDEWFKLEEFELQAGADHKVPGPSDAYFVLHDARPNEGFADVEVFSPVGEQFSVPASGLFKVSEYPIYVLIDQVHDGHVHATSYEAPAKTTSYQPMAAFCTADGAWAYSGRLINGIALHPLANPSIAEPQWVPYQEVFGGSDAAAIFAGGACFWDQFRNEFGDQAIRRAFQGLDAVRDQNQDANDEDYCLVPLLEAAAGSDVSAFVKRFGFPADASVCLPPIRAAEMKQYAGPADAEWCEVSIL